MEPAFPYQETGHKWLTEHPHRILADEMGLGKSRQIVMACDLLGLQRILIVCPAIAKTNWQRQFDSWSIYSPTFKICVELKDKPATKTICSYDYVTANYEILTGPWDVVVLDEGHLVKSIDAQRSLAVWGKNGLVRHTQRVWFVSGTPAPNHAAELWILLYSFGATKLGYDSFVERYCNYYETSRGRQVTGTKLKTTPELKELMRPHIMRRTKEQVQIDLPPIFYQNITLDEKPEPIDFGLMSYFVEWVVPQDRTNELMDKITKERNIIDGVLAPIDRTDDVVRAYEGVAKSISTLRKYTGLKKVQSYLDYIIPELESGKIDKLIIFCLHRDVIETLRVALAPKYKAVTLYGGTAEGTRQKNIDKFMNNPKCRVFIGNVQAAGISVDLTSACFIDLLESYPTPGPNAQAIMRAHRIGQLRKVFVRIFSLANSYDECVNRSLARKIKELTELFDEPKLTKTGDGENQSEREINLKEILS